MATTFDDLVSILESEFRSYSPADGEKRLRGICFSGMDLFPIDDPAKIVSRLKSDLPKDAKVVRHQRLHGRHEAYEVVFHSAEWDSLGNDSKILLYQYKYLPNWLELKEIGK
jgi:hypothetical protein